jgi:hypothetical protein
MNHHQVIQQEVEHAYKVVAELNESIEKLTAQRDRVASFIETMKLAAESIPEQLEFDLVDTPENVVEFKQ